MNLPEAVKIASTRPEVLAAVAQLYSDVQHEIDQRRPICVISGKCCRFEEYGHRLFVTTIELAAFIGQPTIERTTDNRFSLPQAKDGAWAGTFDGTWDGTGCPYQKAKLCTVHAIRPFGCRIFFCDATSTQWQQEQYERFHDRLKRLHETLQVPYFYCEWRAALRQLAGET